MFSQINICVSARVGKSLAKCLSELSVLKILVEKMISPVIFDTDHSFQTVKYSFLDEKIGYRSFYGAPLTFNYFFPLVTIFFKEKFCV